MPLRPLGNRVLVLSAEEISKVGSIHIPDYAVEKQHEGTVVQLGTFKPNEDLPAIGDRVYFRQGYGKEVVLNDKLHVLIALEDILGVIT